MLLPICIFCWIAASTYSTIYSNNFFEHCLVSISNASITNLSEKYKDEHYCLISPRRAAAAQGEEHPGPEERPARGLRRMPRLQSGRRPRGAVVRRLGREEVRAGGAQKTSDRAPGSAHRSAWYEGTTGSQEEFLAAVKKIPGVSVVETQTYTLMNVD